MGKVTLVNIADENEQYILNKDRNIVGRSAGGKNDVNIPLKYGRVSRRHCEIGWDNGELIVKDTNSTRGTYIDGKCIDKKEVLRDGDELGLGPKYVLEVRIEGESNGLEIVEEEKGLDLEELKDI